MAKRQLGAKSERDRVQAYLSAEQIAEINRVRGRYLTESGRDVRITQVFRAALDHFLRLNWAETRRLLDEQARSD